jgi:TPR repeat protein
LLERAAEMGYAPAQAHLAVYTSKDVRFACIQKSAAQGYRRGILLLAHCRYYGQGCEVDKAKGLELYQRAAELGRAQYDYAMMRYDKRDWEFYYWMGRCLSAGRMPSIGPFLDCALGLVRSFEKGSSGRILHTVGLLLRVHFDSDKSRVFNFDLDDSETQELLRIVELHGEMLGCARAAIACWSMAGRRCGVAKDIRVMIAKMAWEEAWRWDRAK